MESIAPRKRLKRYEMSGQARFLTFSCYRRLPLFQNDLVKDVFVHRLAALREEKPFDLLAWVIMPEHVHLVLKPHAAPVSELMRALKRPVAERVLHRWQQLSAPILVRLADAQHVVHFWQAGGGYDRNIRDEQELLEKIDYTHDNPRRRGLVERAIDYVYSSARWYTGIRDGLIAVDPI